MVTSTPFESPADVYNWISRFVNLERGQSVRSFRLDRMAALAEAAGRPEKCAPSIHVAGSKGKGSVTGMIASILEAAGIKTARYASPHVYDFRERLTMGNAFLGDDILTRAGNELALIVDKLRAVPKAALFDPENENGEGPTFFELMTLWFFLCARLSCCGAMAVETGMGGRLDATNIVDPLVSVITVIELEHTEYLGNTIAAIAGEKAGIIKPGRPLVLAEQSGEALDVFSEQARLNGSPLIYWGEHAEVSDVIVSVEGTRFNLRVIKQGTGSVLYEEYADLFVPMCGEIQAKNAALAVLAVKAAFPGISGSAVREGLAGFALPARFERVCGAPPVIVDGAHTARSVDMAIKTFTALYGAGGILVFGCASGKDVLSMAGLCVPCFSRIIITTPGSFKKSAPEEIYNAFTAEARKNNSKAEIIFVPQTREALDKAKALARADNIPILVTGSFYLAGEIKR